MTPPDHNKECWSAFCPNEEVAEKELRKMVEKLSAKKLVALIRNIEHINKYRQISSTQKAWQPEPFLA